MHLDDPVCLCFRVTRRKLVNFVLREQPRVASQLSQCGGAGTGCGWCIPFLTKIFCQTTADASELESISPEEYAAQRRGYVLAGKGTPPPTAIPLPPPPDSTV